MIFDFFITFIGLLIVLFLIAQFIGRFFFAGKTYKGDKTEFFKNGVFSMPGIENDHKGLKDFIRWRFGKETRFKWNEPYTKERIPYEQKSEEDKIKITFINHATTLIESDSLTIITDPIFTKRASPFKFFGPKRHHAPYLRLKDIPKIDVVLISHNHYDHLSIATLRKIQKRFKPLFIVPLNNCQFLEKTCIPKASIHELNLFECFTVKDAKFTLEKAQHWSTRGIGDRNKSLWGSYIIELCDKRIFFAGDTGYNMHFQEIKQQYGIIDVAILPIGAYEPRFFMKEHHMCPDDALMAAYDLGRPKVMSIHFGTFKLTNEGRHDPEKRMTNLIEESKYPETFLIPTLKNGLSLEVK